MFPSSYSNGLGEPFRSGTMATNRGGFAVSVVMSWIGGTLFALCSIANGTPKAAAAITIPARLRAKPRWGVPGRVIHPPMRATKKAARPVHAPQLRRLNAWPKSTKSALPYCRGSRQRVETLMRFLSLFRRLPVSHQSCCCGIAVHHQQGNCRGDEADRRYSREPAGVSS